ncbi:MAG: hypothetical protein LUE24_11395 [Lachnospiraceae bacterium]|nr:hypothetical protein [Lachnospiraceae bacterium]
MIDLGGFMISRTQQVQMIIVIVLYSVVVVALGLYVKGGTGKDKGKLAHFLTGGRGLNSLELAMVTMTFGMAGGTMVSGPGLSYGRGFISIVTIFAGIIGVFGTFGNCGKKVSIVGRRLNASTIVQLLHHRYQSRRLVYLIVIGMTLFVIPKISSQLMISAKLFTAITGGKSYLLGMLIATSATLIYTLSGGLKSVARICVFQGILMVVVVAIISIREYTMVYQQFGSVQAAYEYVAEIQPQLLMADNWQPLYALGMALLYGWASFGQPGATHTALTYRDPKAFSKAIVISVICSAFIQLAMSGSSVLSYALNPNLTQPDYVVVYLSTTMLSGILAGFTIVACFAAVQSTVAGLLLVTAGAICKDLYKECFHPDASEREVSRFNVAALLVIGVLSVVIGLHPTQFTQLLNTFAGAGLDLVFAMPLLFGLYWKDATEQGALWSVAGGLVSYILFYAVNRIFPIFWSGILGNIHPVIPSMLLSLFLMVAVSRRTPKVPLGICEVWFSPDYEERFCHEYDLK